MKCRLHSVFIEIVRNVLLEFLVGFISHRLKVALSVIVYTLMEVDLVNASRLPVRHHFFKIRSGGLVDDNVVALCRFILP